MFLQPQPYLHVLTAANTLKIHMQNPPVEQKKEKFKPNNYVLYKIQSEWNEGRINTIHEDQGLESYTISSFHSYNEISLSSNDSIIYATFDMKRKLRTMIFNENTMETHIPPFLIHYLMADREWPVINTQEMPRKITVKFILRNFRDFLVKESGCYDCNEVDEMYNGFREGFEFFFPKTLLYEGEKKHVKGYEGEYADICGAAHLLRFLYYLQKNSKALIKDEITRQILLDYSVYLFDFLMHKRLIYFDS